MTRYYLHLRYHDEELLDPDGLELPNRAALQHAMLEAARDVISGDLIRAGVIDLRYRIDAETAAGDIVSSLPFKAVVTILDDASSRR
jgi:hypothetical protein